MILEARELEKSFPPPPFSGAAPVRALRGASFRTGMGALGIEGPNGSGKTTLLKTLAGVLTPDTGTVLADGEAAAPEKLRAIAAYCPPNPRSFYFRLSAGENLRFFGALAGLSAAEALGRAARLAERLGLSREDLDRRFDRLSEGTMQKVSLVRAFSRQAPLLLLDEPFRGLDGEAVSGLLQLIAETSASTPVLLASHSPGLLREAAPRVLRMAGGQLKAEAGL